MRLLESMAQYENLSAMEFIITENIRTVEGNLTGGYEGISKIVINDRPKGYAANHNQALSNATGEFFCILNPDVLFIEAVFYSLMEKIRKNLGEIVAPLVVDSTNCPQDSFRPLPTPREILTRRLRQVNTSIPTPQAELIFPDWIAGIFLIMRRRIFQQLGGFDEKYRLYFEDVDFCLRARQAGLKVLVDTKVRVVHDATRLSHRHPKYLLQHLSSAITFFRSKVYRQAKKT